jgi:branched-chain amino acid transport system ATP-binding protein
MIESSAASPDTILAVSGLRCGYGRSEVIHGVDLSVNKGEIACLIGANGAGKTTLIRAILGLVAAREGSVRFRGEDITSQSTAARIERGLAVVPEGRGVLPRLTVDDNLRMGAYVRRRDSAFGDDLHRIFSLFPILAERRQQVAGTLSGGEQQMLVIGRALMSRPQLLILDEPSFGLAPKIVQSIFEVIAGLRETGLTILLVEQNASIALEVAQRGFVLESGSCLLSAEAATLRGDPIVRDIYLGAG